MSHESLKGQPKFGVRVRLHIPAVLRKSDGWRVYYYYVDCGGHSLHCRDFKRWKRAIAYALKLKCEQTEQAGQ